MPNFKENVLISVIPAGTYMYKVNNRNARAIV